MKQTLIFTFIISLLTSCVNNSNPETVHSENNNLDIIELKKDSSFVETADLPIEIDSTNHLIHPIGYFNIQNSRGKIIYKSSSCGSQNFSISNYGGYRLSGNLTNVKFQHKDSDKLTSLTNDFIKIKSLTFLRKVFDNTKKHYLVYEIIDTDSNRDGKLDSADIKSIYISVK